MSTGGIIALAAAIYVIVGSVAAIGISIATGKAAEATGRQPEAADKIRSVTLLGCALAEATAIYGFVIALILLLIYKA
ncbi:MAG: ATP synthase F0 subunit C [Firmicutes bacterium]|nr:ATP synthase F0 subunit C [Bacillota bacterium]